MNAINIKYAQLTISIKDGAKVTIIVGVRCMDGVVIGSDSQQEFSRGVAVKRLNKAKIYVVQRRFAIAGAGTLAHIEKAIDAIDIGLNEAKRRKGGIDLSEDECVDAVEKAITAVYKEYNIDRSNFLGEPRERNFFDPILICGCLENIDGKNSACLFIMHSAGVVEKIPDYATAGSGAAYAELLFKKYYYNNMTIKETIPAVAYVINEVKEIDPNCGGITLITLIDPGKGDIKELTQEEIEVSFGKVKPLLEILEKNVIPRTLRGEIDEQKLREIS